MSRPLTTAERLAAWRAEDQETYLLLKRVGAHAAYADVFELAEDPELNTPEEETFLRDLVSQLFPTVLKGARRLWPKRKKKGTALQVVPQYEGKKFVPKTFTPTRVVQPDHPIRRVKAQAAPEGWFLHLHPAVAQQIAGWWIGRPTTEWSARGLVRSHAYGVPDPQGARKWAFSLYELFRSDDAAPEYVGNRDSGGLTTMLAEWELGIVDELMQRPQPYHVQNLRGHVHSHNQMGAFWSATDENMVGACLDEQAALQTRTAGWVLSLVVGSNLTPRARVDGWTRGAQGIVYWTADPLPVHVTWPEFIRLADVQAVRKTPTIQAWQSPYSLKNGTWVRDDETAMAWRGSYAD